MDFSKKLGASRSYSSISPTKPTHEKKYSDSTIPRNSSSPRRKPSPNKSHVYIEAVS